MSYSMFDHDLGFETFKHDAIREVKETKRMDPQYVERIIQVIKDSPNWERLDIKQRYELLCEIRKIYPRERR